MQNDGSHLHPRSGQGPLHHEQEKQQAVDRNGNGPAAAESRPKGPLDLSQDAYLLTAEDAVRELKTDPDRGLTEDEAKARLQIAGLNELAGGGGVSIGRILAGQIFNAMVLVSFDDDVGEDVLTFDRF